MNTSRWRIGIGFVLWTIYLWGTRIRNVLNDETLTSTRKTISLLLSFLFLVLAVAVGRGLIAMRQARKSKTMVPQKSFENRLQQCFVVTTVIVWAFRIPMIALAGHTVPFVVVHTLLGGVSLLFAYYFGKGLFRSSPYSPPTK